MVMKMKHTSFSSYHRIKNIFKNHLFIIYAGLKNSVCGMTQAKLWGILNKLTPSATIIHPYNSIPIKVGETVLFCSVTFYSYYIIANHIN